MEDITQSLNFIPQNKRTKQKISDELRKLIIDEMNSGSKPKKWQKFLRFKNRLFAKYIKYFKWKEESLRRKREKENQN
jgi:hypothetical protein